MFNSLDQMQATALGFKLSRAYGRVFTQYDRARADHARKYTPTDKLASYNRIEILRGMLADLRDLHRDLQERAA
jgi:hypothetical protein